MLTDDKTIHDILSAVEHSRIPPLETVKAICTRLLEAEARLELVGDLTETAAHKNSEALARALKAEARVKELEAEIADMKRKKQTDQIIAFGAGALLF